MRRHTIRTTKILAIALTAAGCTSNPARPVASAYPIGVTDSAPVAVIQDSPPEVMHAPEVESPPAVEAPPEAAPPVIATPTPEIAEEERLRRSELANKNSDPTLLTLRSDLDRSSTYPFTSYAKSAGNPRFRPLCDSDGYPLVGNVLNKGGGVSVTAFCTALRDNPQGDK